MARTTEALGALVEGFSSFSLFPPFGPRALARSGATALRTRQVVQWGRVVIAAVLGRRSGRITRALRQVGSPEDAALRDNEPNRRSD